MSAAAEDPGQAVLVPHWLSVEDRTEVERSVAVALDGRPVHPVAAIHLEDVLTELQVAAAREVVWPAPSARVRRATGWTADVLPLRLSAAELATLLSLPHLGARARAALTAGRSS